MNATIKQIMQKFLSNDNILYKIINKFHIPSHKSIRTRIIISSILLSIFPIFIMRVFVYPTEKEALQDALIQNLEGVGHKQAELILRWIEERKADAKIVAENPNVPGFEFFQKAVSGITFVSSIAPSVIPLENEYGKLELGMPTLYITTPVVYEHKVIGMVCLRVDVMEISKLMRSVLLGETGETYLINKNGFMISESKFLKDLKDFGIVRQRTTLELSITNPATGKFTRSVEACLKGNSGYNGEGYIDYRGTQVLGFWQWIPELNWGVIAEIDVAEGYGPVKRLHTIVSSIMLIVTIAVISSAFFFGKKMSDPIVYLTEVTKSISEGDYSKRVKITSHDEIGELSNSFNKMASFLEEKTQILTLDQMKDKMIRDVSHELKSPVAQVQMAIDLWSKEVKKEYIDRSKEGKFSKIINDSLQRLRKTIGSILDLSVLESGRMVFRKEPILMDVLVLQTVTTMRLLAEKKGLALINHVNQGLPAVIGDREEIQRVITNLIDNAIKYTERGEIHVFLGQKDASIEFAVKDTGVGIGLPKEQFVKLFERFFQERPRVDGAGVGLAICKNIIEVHKGHLWVESEGRG